VDAAFSPLSLSPDLFVLPEPQYLFQDDAHTTLVDADGQTVGAWLDLGAEGDYWTQSTATNEPIYHTSGGLHWLEAADDSDKIGKSFTLTGDDFYVAMAIRPLAGPAGFNRMLSMGSIGGGVSDVGVGGLALTSQAGGADALLSCGGANASGTMADDTDVVVELLCSVAGATLVLDGVTAGTAEAEPDFAIDDVALLGWIGGNASRLHRNYGFFARRGVPPSTGDRAKLRTYLAALYGGTL
jgi:hypothetical protein